MDSLRYRSIPIFSKWLHSVKYYNSKVGQIITTKQIKRDIIPEIRYTILITRRLLVDGKYIKKIKTGVYQVLKKCPEIPKIYVIYYVHPTTMPYADPTFWMRYVEEERKIQEETPEDGRQNA